VPYFDAALPFLHRIAVSRRDHSPPGMLNK